jgi:hypothetical protein
MLAPQTPLDSRGSSFVTSEQLMLTSDTLKALCTALELADHHIREYQYPSS